PVAMPGLALVQELRVVGGQRANGAQQAHERRGEREIADVAIHRRPLDGLGRIQRPPVRRRGPRILQLGRRERQRQAVAEAHPPGNGIAAVVALAQAQLLHQPHRLEEPKAVRLGQQLLDQARVDSPLRGSHRTSSSPFRADTMTSRVKLLACTYSPKNRSITLANAATPVPTNAASSMVMRILIPRTTDPKCSPDSQAVVGWCSTPVMPSIWWRDTLLDDRSYSRSISLSAGRPAWVSDRWLSDRWEISRQCAARPRSKRR